MFPVRRAVLVDQLRADALNEVAEFVRTPVKRYSSATALADGGKAPRPAQDLQRGGERNGRTAADRGQRPFSRLAPLPFQPFQDFAQRLAEKTRSSMGMSAGSVSPSGGARPVLKASRPRFRSARASAPASPRLAHTDWQNRRKSHPPRSVRSPVRPTYSPTRPGRGARISDPPTSG